METIEAELRQLGKDRARLAQQPAAAVQQKMAEHAAVDRPRDIDALCRQARQGLADLDERASGTSSVT
jgi:hypothetical protein